MGEAIPRPKRQVFPGPEAVILQSQTLVIVTSNDD
jgi:hypothetical protein